MKKILVVDDSALMRSVICDIINNEEQFEVKDRAKNGLEALNLLKQNKYDAVVLDINMPIMDGITLLKELQNNKIAAKILIASTDSKAGADITLEALSLGALDFVHKPTEAFNCKQNSFRDKLISSLCVLAEVDESKIQMKDVKTPIVKKTKIFGHSNRSSNKILAIASSTGGPKALQSVIPFLPGDFSVPVVVVQHMPEGFTASFAHRLNGMSDITVKEAVQGETVEAGTVYLAKGGYHMLVVKQGGRHVISYSDAPKREGVKPCANFTYESLTSCDYCEVVCVVLTGMGADGTQGIQNLMKSKKVYVVAQDEASSAVYGMPRSAVNANLVDQTLPLHKIAQEIIVQVEGK